MRTKLFLSIFLTYLFTANAFAHEYWFEPDNFFPKVNEKTAVHLFVGDGLLKDREERVYQPDKTPVFQLFSASKSWNLKTNLVAEQTPIYTLSAEKPGNYLLAMERNWSYITLEPQKFEDYLKEDGIEYISAERARLNETGKPGRERYSRFLKSLLQVGGKNDNTFKKKLGVKLEIIPLENPYAKKVGDSLGFQVLFDGKPLADRIVFASNKETEKQRFKTDKNGKLSIKIEKDGLWLVHLVVMQRCKADCVEADWESFWGAISFGVQ